MSTAREAPATRLPRLLVTAPGSGGGKTTVAVGLMAALRERGLAVAPFKTGPDYIDPGYHTLAAGRVGRNLDAHLCGPELMVPLLLHGAVTPAPADVAVIEGAMGLFDGALGRDGTARAAFGSAGHVAALTHTPCVLVLDAAQSTRTLAAVASGFIGFDPQVRVEGVILNLVAGERHAAECRRAVEAAGILVLGAIPRDRGLAAPSRHLGLVPAAELGQADEIVAAAGRLVAAHVDLDRVLAVAASAPGLVGEPWDPAGRVEPVAGRPRVAVAGGRAFTFRYAETTELLTAAGCEIVEFDPVADPSLAEGTRALWIGGGFPELHAEALAANVALRSQVAALVGAGMPTVAECAGLLYLCRTLDGLPMSGALGLEARMGERLTLRYGEVTAAADTLLCPAGTRVPSHEFHRTVVDLPGSTEAAWDVDGRREGVTADPARLGRPTVLASYQHLHWAGIPQAASRFAAAAAASPVSAGAPTRASSSPSAAPDLRHHGDRDVVPGLVDLAVNVRAPAPPAWLAAELVAGADRWGAYPDAKAAREALAAAHGVDPAMVLSTAGAAEAFTLLARMRRWRSPLVIHPQFTEPEQALLVAGHRVARHLLRADDGFMLVPSRVPGTSDLVVVGNPTNPTGVLHPALAVRALAGADRVLVVDEAFMDAIVDERESLIGPDMAGVLVLRSLTKTWSLAGLRAGYVVGDPALIAEMAEQQPPWSVSTPAADAMVACSTRSARAAVAELARSLVPQRAALVDVLTGAGLPPVQGEAPFVLVGTSALGPTSLREPLARRGFSVRRGETFPGLGPAWLRLAVRDPQTSLQLAAALQEIRQGGTP